MLEADEVSEEALDLLCPLPRNRRARAPLVVGATGPGGGGLGGTAIPAREGRAPDGPPRLRSQQRPSWEERACLFSSCTGRGGRKRFQSGFTLCYPCPVPPSTPQAAFQNLAGAGGGGGFLPRGEIRLTGEARVTAELLGRSRALPSLAYLTFRKGWSPGQPGPYLKFPWDPLGP